MKKILFCLMIGFTLSALAQEKIDVPFEKVPDLGQRVISSYFKGNKVSSIIKEKSKIKYNYCVTFEDGTILELDKDGNWTNVECNNGVPQSMVPGMIKMHIQKTNVKDKTIIHMIKDRKTGYKIEFINGETFSYDLDFKPISDK